MNSNSLSAPLVRWVMVFASIAILVLAMRAVSDILSPVILAMVLAVSVAPLPGWP